MPWLDSWTGGVESTSLWNGRNISSSASQLRMPSSPSLPWYVVNRALIWPNRCVPRLLSSLSCSGIIASESECSRCWVWRWSGRWRSWLHGKVILAIFGLQFLLRKPKRKRNGPLSSRNISPCGYSEERRLDVDWMHFFLIWMQLKSQNSFGLFYFPCIASLSLIQT